MSRFEQLVEHLVSVGLALVPGAPCSEIHYQPSSALKVLLVFAPAATAQQRAAVEAVVAGWDWTPRRPKALAPLVQELLAFVSVPGGQPPWVSRLAKVACLAAAEALRRDPRLARRLGESIDGDEPDATPTPTP